MYPGRVARESFTIMILPEIASGDKVGCGGGVDPLATDSSKKGGGALPSRRGPSYRQLQKARLYTVLVIFLIVVAACVLLFPLVLLPTPLIWTSLKYCPGDTGIVGLDDGKAPLIFRHYYSI